MTERVGEAIHYTVDAERASARRKWGPGVSPAGDSRLSRAHPVVAANSIFMMLMEIKRRAGYTKSFPSSGLMASWSATGSSVSRKCLNTMTE